MSMRQVGEGTDEVCFDYPLPAGCSMKDLWLNQRVISAAQISTITAVMYGVAGFVVPVLDPDGELSPETLWDTAVPKDVLESAGAFDLDTATQDTTPEFEVGEPDWGAVFQVAGNRPLEFFRRRRLITLADSNVGFLEGTPDTFLPLDRWQSHIKRNIEARVHSHIMLGVSSPSLDRTSSAVPNTLAETEWTMMTYLEDFLLDAMKNLLGLVEAGAETPYAESAAFVAELIERNAVEETAGSFLGANWTVFTQSVIAVDVPGTIAVGTLTSE